jgi:hypothetical protein
MRHPERWLVCGLWWALLACSHEGLPVAPVPRMIDTPAPRAGSPAPPPSAADAGVSAEPQPASMAGRAAVVPPTAARESAGSSAAIGGRSAPGPSPNAAAGSGGSPATAPLAGSGGMDAPIELPDLFPPPSTPQTRVADPNNPPECPAQAPENPIGDCAGLPIYVECKYGTYHCVCDWIHWLCAG